MVGGLNEEWSSRGKTEDPPGDGGGGGRESAETKDQLPAPLEAYERNLDQTSVDVLSVIGKFDMGKLAEAYRENQDRSGPHEGVNFEHTQEFDVSGKKVKVTVDLWSANDDYVETNLLKIEVEGRRYQFDFEYSEKNGISAEGTSLTVKSTVKGSQESEEVGSFRTNYRYSHVRVGYGDDEVWADPGEDSYGELREQEQPILAGMQHFMERMQQEKL
jgi:hypothetical protein